MGIRQIKQSVRRHIYSGGRFARHAIAPRVHAFSKWSAKKIHKYAVIPAWLGVKFGAKHGKRGAKFAHKHVAQRPHEHLQKKVTWYKNWHEWEHHHRVHVGVVSVYLLAAVFLLGVGVRNVLAASDIIETWNFSDSSLFDYDSGVETSGSSVRFKAQNYASDANTMGLFHLDEANGTTAADDSSNHNNATSSTPPTFGTGILNNGAAFDGRDDFFKVSDSGPLSFNFANTIEAWTKFDTNFSSGSHDKPQPIVDKGSYKLFYDNTSGKINYEMANAGATTWSQIGGTEVNGSWGSGHGGVIAQATDGTNVYVGLQGGGDNGAVWRWNGSAWTKIGGNELNGSWGDAIETVNSLTYGNGKLYAGLGQDGNDAAVYEWNGTTWTKIGGSGINGGWATSNETVESLTYMNGKLYAGLGNSTNDARVYEWNGTTWTWVGGFGVTGYTAFPTGYERVHSLVNDGTHLFAGLGSSAGDADVWRLDGTTWTQIGGDAVSSSWAASTYEAVWSMWYQGSTLYAGLGTGTNEAEVWSWNGTTWTQIGGDAVNSSWTTGFETIRSLTGDGTNIYAGLGDSSDDDELWMWNGTTWTKVGGDGVNNSFNNTIGVADASQVGALNYMDGGVYAGLNAAGGDVWRLKNGTWTRIGGDGVNASWGMSQMQSAEAMTTWNGKLYTGLGFNVTSAAVVWEWDGASWRMVGGQGLNGSWAWDEFEGVNTLVAYKNALYAGLGSGTGDAEVWKYDGSTWTRVAGDNLAWNTGYEMVQTMAVNNGKLYAGLGNHGGDAEVWEYDGTTWTKAGGDAVGSSWGATTIYERVNSLSSYKDDLYAGLGNSGGDAELWKYSGGSWAKVGGDGVNSSWPDATFEQVLSQTVHNGELYVSLGVSAGDAEVWKYDGTTWAKVGAAGTTWGATIEAVYSLISYNGDLYAGLGDSGGDAEIWRYSNGSWSQLGGDSLNLSWGTGPETVRSLAVYQGKLLAGLGHENADAMVWVYGNNASLSSNANTQDTGWHHIAATYDGTNMKIFIDGVENASKSVSNLMPDTHHQLFIGSSQGSLVSGMSEGHFKGQLDEVRISNTARTGFTTKPYVTTKQLVTLKNAILTGGVKSWDSFSASETPNGGAISYRLSADGGTTWQYWDNGEWKTSASPDHANTAAVVNSHISDFPVTYGGLKWQAVMQGDGFQRVTLNNVEVQASSDNENPEFTTPNIQAQKTNGGSTLAADAWTNGGAPYFAWDDADDNGGIKGYCVYVGQDNTADPAFTKGMLGASPLNAGGHCQFLVDPTSLDLGSPGYLGTQLSTSSTPYVVRIRAIDNAGNLSDDTAQFQFKFDNTPPSNPAFVNAPSGVIMDKEATLTWPTAGGTAAQDAQSGVAGLQYRINDTTWYGDAHSGTGDNNDLLVNDGTYTTQDPPDYDNLQDGVNTVYFRTWDQAGNVTTSYTVAAVRVNTTGAPTEPQNVTVNPGTNVVNAFAFDWDAPATFAGEQNKLTYCYTVNTLPSANTCTFTSPGVTSLGAGPYATQPGANTFYVVARDEMNNINYASLASRTFSANTPSPGIPISVDVVDVSVKASATWRLALTWDRPTNVGAGISSYRVYRSTDNANFTQIGSSASTTYIDAGLSQQRYYYRVTACDNTNNCGAPSTVVDDMPTGRFTEPAELFAAPTVSNVTTKKARIAWVTNRDSDSRIALGTKSGEYSSSEVTVSKQVTSHIVDLDNLSAGTTYYYIAKWTDEDGNTGQSQEYTFTTSPAPSLKEIQTVRVGLTSAVVQFTSRNAVRASVYYGTSESFGGVEHINTSASESTYNVELNGLNDGTKYYYKVVTYDDEGTSYDGSVFSFTTPSRPRISNVRFEPIEGEPTSTQRITWQTNVPANSSVNYGKLNTAGTDILQSNLVTEHEVIVRGLEDNSEYFVIAQSRDANGNIAVSDRQQFKTALDTRAPKVSDITVESSIRGTGAEARGQIVVSWKTDEPATSQVAYGEGSGLQNFNNRTSEDTTLSTEHIVIVSDLPPSRVYSVRPISADASGNSTNGITKSAIIGRAPDGITTIVFDALRRIFGY